MFAQWRKNEWLIARKLLEISRTEVLISPHASPPPKKRKRKVGERKEKNVSVNRHCLGEFRVIYSGGQGVGDRYGDRWLINPPTPPLQSPLSNSSWLEVFSFCSFWKQVSFPSNFLPFFCCPVHFPLASVTGISLYNNNTCVFPQIELCKVPYCSPGNSCISDIMSLLTQRRKGGLCWERLTRQGQHVPEWDKSILEPLTSSLENDINPNIISNSVCKETTNIWSNV